MGQITITDPVTETQFIGSGDRLTLTPTGSITAGLDGEDGISSEHPVDNARLRIEGDITADRYGVHLVARTGGNFVHIAETARIMGHDTIRDADLLKSGILLSGGSNQRVLNEGWIGGDHNGVVAFGTAHRITNTGTIESGSWAMAATDATDVTLRNTGDLFSHLSAILVDDSANAKLFNSGDVQSTTDTIRVKDSNDAKILNLGQVHSTERAGLTLVDSERIAVCNEGSISGQNGVTLLTSTGVVKNSGTISGTNTGLVFYGDGKEGDLTVLNHGVISGGNAGLSLNDRHVVVKNHHRIEGDIAFAHYWGEVHGTIANSGVIDGDIRFNDHNDSYRAQGDGLVTGRVYGMGGDDTLIGGARGDRFIGGDGKDRLTGNGAADTLSGGGGNDRLNGGQGADRIEGGAGKDRLTGGSQSDTFVFGTGAGHDRITDWQPVDRIEIQGHQGGFATLTISATGTGLSVTHDGGTILLVGQPDTALTSGDFIFV